LVTNKTLLRSLLILSILAVVLEGCYFFCLFRPESAFEDVVEEFVEGTLGNPDLNEHLEESSPSTDAAGKQ
jgi:hypothetical protein